MHLYNYPMGFLPLDFYGKIKYAQFLHDGSEIRIRNPPNNHGQSGELKPVGGLSLPMLNPDVVVPVIEFFL
ncbi:MAG: hypothetical protein IJC66_12685 [Kiritimatiellae bacterium]|nr:hypothetical protein [Kiritimatiellia bacterium]